jgi:glycosyltransferase involved in cell wall biosynthesis
MKIYVIPDHTSANKTMLETCDIWRGQGHEVQVDMYYDIEKANWCDVIFGEYIQGGVCHAVLDKNISKPIVMRGIDIDLYFGHYMGLDWDRCKSVLFINDYMKDYTCQRYFAGNHKPTKCNIDVVKLGINADKWTFNDKSKSHGKTVGWLNNFWSGKGIDLLVQIIYKLCKLDNEYNFKVVGSCSEPWLEQYFEEFIKRNGLKNNVERIDRVVDVNSWMDNIDFIMSTSMKECQSLPMLEGMAKGIKPIIHHWWDAKQLYPESLVFQSVDEAIEMILHDYDSNYYRNFVEQNYDVKKQANLLLKYLQV